MKYKIIADSSCDLLPDYLAEQNIAFSIVPFTVNVDQKQFVDTPDINTLELLDALEACTTKPVSACPSPQAFLDQLNGADKYFIVTISEKLSGSLNSATVAKNSFSRPNDVCIVDSRLVSGTMILIIDKLVELINKGLEYEAICEQILSYAENDMGLMFTLNDYSNLVRNGRMSAMQALLASKLSIRPLCRGENGQIKVIKKVMGVKRVLKDLVATIAQDKLGSKRKGTCIIAHTDGLETATTIEASLKALNIFEKIRIIASKGLCAFYSMRRGAIISYEK